MVQRQAFNNMNIFTVIVYTNLTDHRRSYVVERSHLPANCAELAALYTWPQPSRGPHGPTVSVHGSVSVLLLSAASLNNLRLIHVPLLLSIIWWGIFCFQQYNKYSKVGTIDVNFSFLFFFLKLLTYLWVDYAVGA